MRKLILPLAALSVTLIFLVMENLFRDPVTTIDEDPFVEEIQRKEERRKAGYSKNFDEPDQYIQFHADIRTPEGETEMAYKTGYRVEALNRMKKVSMLKGTREQLPWIERGPANVPGRTRGLIVDPDDPTEKTWFAGAVGGGIWKTTDEGINWVKITPFFSNLATTVLAMAPSNSNIIYAGTGEGFYAIGMIDGDGIFKSADKGETWVQLAATSATDDFQNVNRIIVDPEDPDVLLACTNTGSLNAFRSGIYKSENGGETWRQVYNANDQGRVQQLIYHPSNFNVQYAAVHGRGVLKSTDAGETWSYASEGIVPSGRVEIAVAPTNPDRLYASVEGNISGEGSDLYTTGNGGLQWSLVLPPEGLRRYNFLGGQGWFDNTIAVEPFDDRRVYFGGVNLFHVSLRQETGTLPGAFLGVEEVNTSSFLEFINFGADYFGGRLEVGNLPAEQMVTVEVRFGNGRKQKAHRFTVPPTAGTNGDGGAGVPAGQYQYQDYVDVPFEVWDMKNNRQLMVSFRDQQRDGQYDLESWNPDQPSRSREYVFIQALQYSETAHPSIAFDGGQEYQQMYFFWPVLPAGGTWDADNLPDSKMRINWGSLDVTRADFTVISDAYNQFSNPGKNNFSQTGFHPDQHNLIMMPVDPVNKTFRFLVANDGGVFLSKTGTFPGSANFDFLFRGRTYNTTQFYGADKRPGSDRYIGGSQDNGTWWSPSSGSADKDSDYQFVIGGDGFEVVWHYEDPNKAIGGSQYNGFRRTVNGSSWQVARTGLADVGAGLAPFISRLANSKSNPEVLYAVGVSGIWRSYNFGMTWFGIPINQSWTFGSYTNIKVSNANYNIVLAGGAMSSTGRIHVSVDNGHSFTPMNNYGEVSLGRISGLGSHPAEDSTLYVLFSFARKPKILRTRNLGQTWEDLSGFGTAPSSNNGFPDVAVYTILHMPHHPDVIWAGTEIGIVESIDNGQTWMLADNGLPNVSVWDLKVVDDQVVAATHGRGIWSVTIPEINKVPFITVFSRQSETSNVDLQVRILQNYDSLQVFVNNEKEKTVQLPAIGLLSDVLQIPVEGSYTCYVISWMDGSSYKSASKNITSNIYTGIEHLLPSEREELLVYPNPSPGTIWFDLPEGEGLLNIELYNLQGSKVHGQVMRNQGTNSLQVPAGLTDGYYLLMIRQGSKLYAQKLLISR